jgi:lipopolysaccharide transport system ATP-binding protein
MNYPAIVAKNISKRYRIGLIQEPRKTLATSIVNSLRSPFDNLRQLRQLTRFSENGDEKDVIWALKDVSFKVEPGEVVGIIGRNGAGKSTLLKIISRITHPTNGRLELRGKVSSLLEVGTGFHPELTGRENIFLNGTILGMRRREIERKFDEIVDFSGVEQFVDTPIKRYSTGMRVRLAFSVAAHLEPDILLVDEVLAVGDALFQKKSLGKMKSVASHGRTVLFVSHQMDSVRSLCSRAILLSDGRIEADGDTDNVVDRYMKTATEGIQSAIWHGQTTWVDEDRGMTLLSVYVHDGSGNPKSDFWESEEIHISVVYRLDKKYKSLGIKVRISTSNGSHALSSTDAMVEQIEERGPGHFKSTCIIPARTLNEADYTIHAWGRISNGQLLTRADLSYVSFSVINNRIGVSSKERFPGIINPALPRWQIEPSQ